MSFIDENWFWVGFAALVVLISFLLIYLEDNFSTPAILCLVLFVLLVVLIIIGLFVKRANNDVKRGVQLITDLITPNKQAQKEYMRVTLDALQKAGNTGLVLTQTTTNAAIPAFAKGFAAGNFDIAKTLFSPM